MEIKLANNESLNISGANAQVLVNNTPLLNDVGVSDLSAEVQSAITLANSAYQKPNTGIAKADLASAVQTSLGKADTALQSHQSLSNYYTKSEVDTAVNGAKSNWINEGNDNVKLAATGTSIGNNNRCVLEGNYGTVDGSTISGGVANVHVEGNYCVGANHQAHAEGYYSKASGQHAHAEGRHTSATADGAHSEGWASGTGTEGNAPISASAQGAHAEGYAPSGSVNSASGRGSHVEGIGTTAQNDAEHAEGKYNVSTASKTISSIGVGTDTSDKKNAFEVQTDGTAYIKGVGTFDGTNAAAGTNDVATVIAGKQNTLVSGTNIKTINNTSILGSGNIKITGVSGGNWTDVGDNSVQIAGSTALATDNSGINKRGAVAAGYYTYANKRYTSTTGQNTIAGTCTGANPDSSLYPRWYKYGDVITQVNFKSTTSTDPNRDIPSTTIDADMGVGAHAEGVTSTAFGNNSHAEGNDTVALNSGCHTEGYHTIAVGSQSHAEGSRNDAFGAQSHAEGKFTRASGAQAHAEGLGDSTSVPNLASGKASHVEGAYNVASGEATHAEGEYTKATGKASHAEGLGRNASGVGNLASGIASHAEGYDTRATGDHSHAEGTSTEAIGDNSHAEGEVNRTEGDGAHAEGYGGLGTDGFGNNWSFAYGAGSHVEGAGCNAWSGPSHASGFRTVASAMVVGIGLQNSTSEDRLVYLVNWGEGAGNEVYFVDDNGNTFGYSFDDYYLPVTTDAYVGKRFYWIKDSNGNRPSSDPGYYCKEVIYLPKLSYWPSEGARIGHTEGVYTRTVNQSEHAEGQYNKSNFASATYGNAGNTQHSVGIGTANNDRKNAFEIMQNGDVYVIGLGGYDGTNAAASGVKTLQTVISDLSTLIQQVQNLASAGL